MNEVFFLESQTSATRQIHFSHIKKTLFKWYCILSFDRKKLRNFSKSARHIEVITKLAKSKCLIFY